MILKDLKCTVSVSLLLAVALLRGAGAHAQVNAPDIPYNKYPALIEEQYIQGHYAVAARSARAYLQMAPQNVNTGDRAEHDKAQYYLASSELRTDVPGATTYAAGVIAATANPVYRQRLSYGLAQYHFRHDEWAAAIPLYETASINNLDNNEIGDEKFELAYCYFNNKEFDKARPLFASIKEIKDSKYYMAGNYYYGLLCYNENKYAEALRSFDKVKEEKEYRTIVPYYIAEIYYFQGNRARALSLSDSLLKRKEKSFYDKELHLLVAQCLFEGQRYKEAKPYFEYYYEHTDKIRKEDLYEMAYCYYRADEWPAAIEKFRMLSNAQDSLGQTAMYLLGDCYLKTGDKPSARNAFGFCADMTFNKGQQEAAMILYARLSYESGNTDDALRQLNTLLETFYKTKYRDEANTMISGLLLQTNNYDDALKHLEVVVTKDKSYWTIYQKACFVRGIQLFRNGDIVAANNSFTQSLLHPEDGNYEIATNFWKGELAYRLHHYDDVITYSQRFVSGKGNIAAAERISPLATLQHAYLNMGYAAMELQNYKAAQEYFDLAQENKGKDAYSSSVAALRTADAVFMQKNYGKAITLYDKIIATGGEDAEYATFQKGILLGLQGKNSEKIELMRSLTKRLPPSVYANSARYEIALTYLELDKDQQALTYLKALTDSVTDKSLAPKAWMKIGFIHQQASEYPKAIEAYKHVVIDHPASEERMSAMEALKSLYIQNNQPSAYTQLLRDNNLPSADSSSLDSTYYAAAETQFAAGKMDNARQAFTSYLRQYPNGIFAIKAHYYRAESNYQLKKFLEARDDYNVVLAAPWNDFSENSARRGAAIATDLKDHASAYIYYEQLRHNNNTSGNTDARSTEYIYRGLMKSGYNLSKYTDVGIYADTLLAMKNISAEATNDALFYKARTLQQLGKADDAMAIYKQLSGNKSGELAAEARYHIAELLMAQNKLKEAEEAANESIRLSAGYDDWVGRSYILLADVLMKEKDYFNAKALLQSIVKHTKVADLKQEATKKLEEVKKAEKRQSKLSEE